MRPGKIALYTGSAEGLAFRFAAHISTVTSTDLLITGALTMTSPPIDRLRLTRIAINADGLAFTFADQLTGAVTWTDLHMQNDLPDLFLETVRIGRTGHTVEITQRGSEHFEAGGVFEIDSGSLRWLIDPDPVISPHDQKEQDGIDDVYLFASRLMMALPGAVIGMHPPIGKGSTWWYDIRRGDIQAVLAWDKTRGYALSVGPSHTYGDETAEVFHVRREILLRLAEVFPAPPATPETGE